MLAGGGVPNLHPSSTFNFSGKGAGSAAFSHGVVVGKVIARLKAGAAASAARIIATDKTKSMRLNSLPPSLWGGLLSRPSLHPSIMSVSGTH